MKLRVTYKHLLVALGLCLVYASPSLAHNLNVVAEYEGVIAEAEVIAFVHQELRMLGFPGFDQVVVVKAIVAKGSSGQIPATKIAANTGSTRILSFYARKTKDGRDMIQVPVDLYQTIKYGTEQELNLMRAFIGHEAAHLRLNHLDDPSTTSYWPACIGSLCQACHNRSHEKEADEGVRNDPAILYAISDYFFKKNIIARAALAKLSWFDEPYLADLYGTSSFWNLWSTHPTYAARAKRFKERADALAQAISTSMS